MRLMKLFSMAGLAAVVALAVVGASSASAEFPTQLCKSSESLTCENPVSTLHLALQEGTVGKLLSNLVTILCLNTLVEASLLELGEPQYGHVELSFNSCGTNSAHSNCVLTTEEKPLGYLLKIGKGEGRLVGESGLLRLQCSNLGINCLYSAAGMEAIVTDPGSGEINESPIEGIGGKFFCPQEARIDAIGGALESVYIRS